MLVIQPSILGNEKLKAVMAAAPNQIRGAITTWMMKEKKRYVGNKGTYGIFRKQLMRLKRGPGAPGPFQRGGKWNESAAGAFSGYVKTGKEAGSEQMTKWGLGLKRSNPFVLGLQKLDVSIPDKTITSGKWMAVPVYKNLSKVGIRPGKGGLQEAQSRFDMTALQRGDKLLWFARTNTGGSSLGGLSGAKGIKTSGKYRKSQLLFVGKKEIKLKSMFDFEKQYSAQENQAMGRLDSILARRIRALQEGYVSFR